MSRPKNKAKVPCWIFKVKAMHWKPKGKAKKFLKFKLPEMDGYGKSTVKFSSPFFIAVHSLPRKMKVKKTSGWILISSRDLEKEFGRYGPLEKCKVVLDGKSGQVNPLKTFLNRFKLLCSREALPFWPLKESMMLRRQGIQWLIQVGTVVDPDPSP